MEKYLCICLLFVAATVFGAAPDGDALWTEFLSIGAAERDPFKRPGIAEQYLASLTKTQFLALVAAYDRDPEYAKSPELITGMAHYATVYLNKGAGRDEPFVSTFKQISDPTLPSSWKSGLLYALNIASHYDMHEEDATTMVAQLLDTSQDHANPDQFRYLCLEQLGWFLSARRNSIIMKTPELKNALWEEDTTVLSEMTKSAKLNENARKAVILIGHIDDYRTAQAKVSLEVKEEWVAQRLRKRIEDWQPGSHFLCHELTTNTTVTTSTR